MDYTNTHWLISVHNANLATTRTRYRIEPNTSIGSQCTTRMQLAGALIVAASIIVAVHTAVIPISRNADLQKRSPDMKGKPLISSPDLQKRSSDMTAESLTDNPDLQKRSPDMTAESLTDSPDLQKRSPDMKGKPLISSPDLQKRSPDMTAESLTDSPDLQKRSPDMTAESLTDSPDLQKRSPDMEAEPLIGNSILRRRSVESKFDVPHLERRSDYHPLFNWRPPRAWPVFNPFFGGRFGFGGFGGRGY
ncbi:hypothetical protein BDEG_21901 [Batrachochytrium dendrobatidis JEL423]|nr:hypothetical protein BDEG_21901 [Batrachochytrium dendrobatidis JEL423]